MASALGIMVRNLCMRSVFPAWPARSCTNMTGPCGSSSLMNRAMRAMTGTQKGAAASTTSRSMARLAAR